MGEFIRGIVDMDMNAAKEAFAVDLNEVNLDKRQIYFVNQIVEYIVQNDVMKDLSALQEVLFTDCGSITDLFDDLNDWQGIRTAIEHVNSNGVGNAENCIEVINVSTLPDVSQLKT